MLFSLCVALRSHVRPLTHTAPLAHTPKISPYSHIYITPIYISPIYITATENGLHFIDQDQDQDQEDTGNSPSKHSNIDNNNNNNNNDNDKGVELHRKVLRHLTKSGGVILGVLALRG